LHGDYATALKLWTPLAEQGDVEAQNNLGTMYANGQGVPQDYATAANWYGRAAGQGLHRPNTTSVSCYANGRGVRQDEAEVG
jgi:TPR repeat protein